MAGIKPHTSNGTTPDPREQICWDIYIEKLSKGDDNAYQSAIEAGYSTSSAKNITMRDWFKDKLRKITQKGMLSKSERNLDKVLDFEMMNDEGKVIPEVAKLVVDVSKTIVKTLGKDDYSERNELTGKDGKDLIISFDPVFKDK